MRKIAVALVAATMLTGCVTNQNAGAVVGGVAGGLLGSTVGGGSGRLLGTGIGAAIGTMVGSSIGQSMDEQNRAVHQPYHQSGFASSGEEAAYNRGRAERQAQIQAQREQNAYMRGYRGY